MWDNLDYSELNKLLQDAVEEQDFQTFCKIKEEIDKRIASYE